MRPNECQSHTAGIHTGKSLCRNNNTKARPHPCTTTQFRLDHVWTCMNARQSRRFSIKASKEHQTQRRHWKDCWPQNVSAAPKGRLECLKDLRSKREAIWTSIRNGASDRGSCRTLTSAGWADEATLPLPPTELGNRGRQIRNTEESGCILFF